MGRRIAIATLIAGALGILWAIILTVAYGRKIGEARR